MGDGKLVFITGDDFKTYNKKVKVRLLETLTVEYSSYFIRHLSTLTYLKLTTLKSRINQQTGISEQGGDFSEI